MVEFRLEPVLMITHRRCVISFVARVYERERINFPVRPHPLSVIDSQAWERPSGVQAILSFPRLVLPPLHAGFSPFVAFVSFCSSLVWSGRDKP